jgi:hypothetical protein
MNLSDWIAPALEALDVTAAEIAALIRDLEADLAKTRVVRREARVRAIDPFTADSEVPASRAEETEATFREERITAAIERLKQRHELAVSREEEATRRAEIEIIKSERDALAEELRDKYPRLAAEIADLLSRVRANDTRASAHHLGLSDGHYLAARVRLPALEPQAAAMGERFWPPPSPDMSVVLPPALVDSMAKAGADARATTEAGLAMRARNAGHSTKRLPA